MSSHDVDVPELSIRQKSDFLESAKRRFNLSQKTFSDRRIKGLDTLRFYWGDQWSSQDVTERENAGRPCLTINRTKAFVRQVTNEERLNRPAVLVDPVADTDIETADIEMGIIRHIVSQSDGDIAIDTAARHAAIHGEGWFTLHCEYVDLPIDDPQAQSFNQEIYVREIRNPFTIFDDPNAKLPNREDSKYRFEVYEVTREAFREMYPDSDINTGLDWGPESDGWINEDGIRLAKYWYIEEVKRTLCLMQDGAQVWKKDIPKEYYPMIEREREWCGRQVKWAIINGVEILEHGDWAGNYFPHIRVVGDEINIDGEDCVAGLVDDMVGPQITYNYWVTAAAERLALSTKSPWIVPAGALEGFEDQWERANKENFAWLYYKPTTANGELLPAPTRNDSDPSIAGYSHMVAQADNDLKAVSGIYDAALGSRGPEQSGLAINARKSESQLSNLHFMDNLKRSVKFMGKLLIDLMPKIYDTERVVRIIKPNDTAEMVAVNTQPDPMRGVKKFYDLTTGQYDVRVQAGKNYATARQEMAESMVELTKAYPPVFQAAGDIMVGAMDFPEAQEVAKRLRKMMPPELQGDDQDTEIPPQVQARLQQLDQFAQQATQVIEQLSAQLESKNDEIASRERIAAENNNTKLLMKIADLDAKMGQLMMSQEYASAKHEIDVSRADQQMERAHEQALESKSIDQQAAEQQAAQLGEQNG
jgi:hypothetical protein